MVNHIYIYIYICNHTRSLSSPVLAAVSLSWLIKIYQRGVQWKQGLVICMMFYTI